MSAIIKKIRKDNTGDYTQLSDAIADIINIVEDSIIFELDGNEYETDFNIDDPTKSIRIEGKGSYIKLTDISIINSNMLYIDNVYFDCSDLLIGPHIFTFSLIMSTYIDNVIFLNPIISVMENYGKLFITNVSAVGNNTNDFINSYNMLNCNNMILSHFFKAIEHTTEDVSFNNVVLYNNITSIILINSIAYISNSLIYNCSLSVKLINSSLDINISTIADNISTFDLDNSFLKINESIISSDNPLFIIDPIELINVEAINSSLSPSIILENMTNVDFIQPHFNNPLQGDYRLILNEPTNSILINKININIGLDIVSNSDQFIIYPISNEKTVSNFYMDYFTRFIYTVDDTLIFSDYDKEIQLASVSDMYDELHYTQYGRIGFELDNVSVIDNFDKYLYDWDYIKLKTSNILEEEGYIIPRTIIDIKSLIEIRFNISHIEILWNKLNKDNIRPLMKYQYRGTTIDNNSSEFLNKIQWVIEGITQTLIKINIYSGEIYERYPLLCQDEIAKSEYVKPRGLKYLGVDGNKFKFINEVDISKEYFLNSSNGELKLLNTGMDRTLDVYGIYAYKNNLYITCTKSDEPIMDSREESYKSSGIGMILTYNNYSDEIHYMESINSINGPKQFILSNDITCPTDLTITEDGKLMIMDYYSDKLKIFKFAYDYALIQSSYNSETRAFLREDYEDVQFSEV